jgi:hypothetical protein
MKRLVRTTVALFALAVPARADCPHNTAVPVFANPGSTVSALGHPATTTNNGESFDLQPASTSPSGLSLGFMLEGTPVSHGHHNKHVHAPGPIVPGLILVGLGVLGWRHGKRALSISRAWN